MPGCYPPGMGRNLSRLAVLAAVAAVSACRTVPYTGRHQLSLIPQGEETALGLSAYRDTLGKARLSDDPAQTAMVRRVGERIAQAADRPDFQWEFNVIKDDKMANAFCLPGGKVAVYTGILPLTRDDTGLAVVLGHEIAHALARHGGERMSQGLLAQLGGAALSVALADQPSQTSGLMMSAYGAGAQVGVLLPFSRAHESEADRIGLILMAKAGYDPRAAVGFWGRMAEGKGEPGLAGFLGTHPADKRRIADIQSELPEALKYYQSP